MNRRSFLRVLGIGLAATTAMVVVPAAFLAPSAPPAPRPLTEAEKRSRIIEAYMATPNGRARLAASMTQPLRQRLEYNRIARECFTVEHLPLVGV